MAAGMREQERELERPVLAREHGGVIARAQLVAERRQKHHADGDADHAERQLEQAVGIVEPRHDAILKRGDDRRDDQRDLRHAAGEDARNGERREAPHLGGESRPLPRKTHADPGGGGSDDENLQQARGGDAPGKRRARRALIFAARGDEDEQHGDEHDIEERGGEGGDGEAAEGVEDAGIERDDRHEHEIGKRDAREEDGEREFLRIAGEARRENEASATAWRSRQEG